MQAGLSKKTTQFEELDKEVEDVTGDDDYVEADHDYGHNDDDDDLYIIGAVCMSVCHVFAYFIFSLF